MRQLPNGVTELIDVTTHVCLPGEPVLLLHSTAVVEVGGGLAYAGMRKVQDMEGEVLVATLCGPLERIVSSRPGDPIRYVIATASRYLPREGDPVLATVLKVNAMNYSVSIGAAHPALLDGLAFDGATKTNRPRLMVGDHVYAHVSSCKVGLEAEVSCCAQGQAEAKDWTTGEGLYGPLRGGTVVRVPIPFARQLLQPGAVLLQLIGARVPYEVCVGSNGRVWVRGGAVNGDPKAEQTRTVVIAACIQEAQYDGSIMDLKARVESYFPHSEIALAQEGGAVDTPQPVRPSDHIDEDAEDEDDNNPLDSY